MARCYKCGKSAISMLVVCDECAVENTAKDDGSVPKRAMGDNNKVRARLLYLPNCLPCTNTVFFRFLRFCQHNPMPLLYITANSNRLPAECGRVPLLHACV